MTKLSSWGRLSFTEQKLLALTNANRLPKIILDLNKKSAPEQSNLSQSKIDKSNNQTNKEPINTNTDEQRGTNINKEQITTNEISDENINSINHLVQQQAIVNINDQLSLSNEIKYTNYLPRGNGRSYGDVCTNSNGLVLSSLYLDHFIDFNPSEKWIKVQAGVILKDLQRFLVPQGYMLPVTPGTQLVTVGGAIANDVHCKNHHRYGTFGNHVKEFKLLRSDGEILTCSPNENEGYFKATIGGLGLTGVITEATLALKEVKGCLIDAENIPYSNLQEFFALANSSEADYEHTVSWIDCITGNGERGIFMRGNNSDDHEHYEINRNLKVPFEMPFSLINKFSLYSFNKLYYFVQQLKNKPFKVHYEKFFYPLDHILEWNRIYGKKGFFQYQCVIPTENGIDAISEMQKQIAQSGTGSFLGVLKTFGDYQTVGLLSFPYKGFTYALDFPNQGKLTQKLFERLDRIVLNAKGRLYLAKDVRQPRELFESGYGSQMEEFCKYRDPKCSSDLSRRLMGF